MTRAAYPHSANKLNHGDYGVEDPQYYAGLTHEHPPYGYDGLSAWSVASHSQHPTHWPTHYPVPGWPYGLEDHRKIDETGALPSSQVFPPLSDATGPYYHDSTTVHGDSLPLPHHLVPSQPCHSESYYAGDLRDFSPMRSTDAFYASSPGFIESPAVAPSFGYQLHADPSTIPISTSSSLAHAILPTFTTSPVLGASTPDDSGNSDDCIPSPPSSHASPPAPAPDTLSIDCGPSSSPKRGSTKAGQSDLGTKKCLHLACYFCRGRKIACSLPSGGPEKSCNQCLKRGFQCVFPLESHRGQRAKKSRKGVVHARRRSTAANVEDSMEL